jgi:hypothetical protein
MITSSPGFHWAGVPPSVDSVFTDPALRIPTYRE